MTAPKKKKLTYLNSIPNPLWIILLCSLSGVVAKLAVQFQWVAITFSPVAYEIGRIVYNICLGSLVSLVFYLVVVHVSDFRRRLIVGRCLSADFSRLKHEVVDFHVMVLGVLNNGENNNIVLLNTIEEIKHTSSDYVSLINSFIEQSQPGRISHNFSFILERLGSIVDRVDRLVLASASVDADSYFNVAIVDDRLASLKSIIMLFSQIEATGQMGELISNKYVEIFSEHLFQLVNKIKSL